MAGSLVAPMHRECGDLSSHAGVGVAAGLRANKRGQPLPLHRWYWQKLGTLVQHFCGRGALGRGSDRLVFGIPRRLFPVAAPSPVSCVTDCGVRLLVLLALVGRGLPSSMENRGQLDKRVLCVLPVYTGGILFQRAGSSGTDGDYLGPGGPDMRARIKIGAHTGPPISSPRCCAGSR